MVRFCDREVDCVEYSSLTRAGILAYFLPDHKEDMLCVYDSFDAMGYVGVITYDSFKNSLSVNGAIKQEYVILNTDIWKNAREYFRYREKELMVDRLLPVLDEEYRLICFAYEDVDANREIRMLRELSEHSEALQFSDLYPEYQCVRIYEFNELAYFFAKYLESQNISVQVQGEMWRNFFAGKECEVPEYACLTVYAEGVAGKKQNILENILQSVSVEFECIDQIYETNIKKGIFCNAEESWEKLAERLKKEREIVIIGTDIAAQRTYGFLIKNEINVCCFMGEHQKRKKMYGKKILNSYEVRSTYKLPIYIECTSKGSAWGIGGVDNYDYIGCERNKRFILLRDYIEVPDDSVIDAIRNRKTALIGDRYLCQRLYEYLIQNGVVVERCLVMLPQDDAFEEILGKQANHTDKDITWLTVYPEAWDWDVTWLKEEERIMSYCQEKEIDDYSDCFSDIETYVNVESKGILPDQLKPKKIVIGSIDDHSGNVFFRGLLDSHPSILMIADYAHLNNNLFWVCVSLSMVCAKNILPVFWETYGDIAAETIYDKQLFNKKMEQLLEHKNRVTSQQLFVMFHVAYMYMEERDISQFDLSDMIIYWEPHDIPRQSVEDFAKWLGGGTPCSIVNIVRNRCMQIGSRVKMRVFKNMVTNRDNVLSPCKLDKKKYDKVERLTIRFEDLKCEPEKALLDVCDCLSIPWSDSLMGTTRHGKKDAWFNAERMVSDFDIGPVYDTYEKYLTELDRLRIMIFNGMWQKKYGYPYVELAQFSRRELQELFLKSYRIEDLTGSYKIDEASIGMQKRIWDWLQELRMYELMTR